MRDGGIEATQPHPGAPFFRGSNVNLSNNTRLRARRGFYLARSTKTGHRKTVLTTPGNGAI
jgi:hypothetical protein